MAGGPGAAPRGQGRQQGQRQGPHQGHQAQQREVVGELLVVCVVRPIQARNHQRYLVQRYDCRSGSRAAGAGAVSYGSSPNRSRS